MSMLTEQTKKLRKAAYEVENFKNGTIGLLTRDSLMLADAARQMVDAADTIENLRNRLTEYGMYYDTEDYVCPQCGTVMDYVTRGDDDEKVIPMDDYVIPLHYCPSCGRQVVE